MVKLNVMKKSQLHAFTLVEIMMVMAIVALLVSVTVIEGVQFRKRANECNCIANLKAIASGFEIYSARHAGAYAPGDRTNLRFLIDDGCIFEDLINSAQAGNFRYLVSSINPEGYDIRGIAVNPVLADHNYQILSGGILKRTDTSVSSDTDFKDY